MTREQYISDKLDRIRKTALEKARNTFSENTVRLYKKDPKKKSEELDYYKSGMDAEVNRALSSDEYAGVLMAYGADIDKAHSVMSGILKESNNSPGQAYRYWYNRYLEAETKGDEIELANCIANLSRFYPHGLPTGNQTFRANPSKYGFKEIDTWNVKPGDLVQTLGKEMIPYHAMMYNGVDTTGVHTFNYSSGSGEKSWGVGKYFPDAVHPDKKHLNDVYVYRYVGTPQDSIQWTNEWLQSQQAKNFNIGGKINYLTVFKNE